MYCLMNQQGLYMALKTYARAVGRRVDAHRVAE
jgi:hypothetical protein